MSDNVNKMNQSSALNDRAPAQMVGGMRVGQGNRRTSLASAQKSKEGQQEENEDEENEQQQAEMDKRRQEHLRQENAMRTQQAAREMNISNNAGSQVHSRTGQAYQPRDLNH